MSSVSAHDMTQGPVRGHLLRIAGFICVSMVLQVLYSLVDLYWVGHLGAHAIAAVSIGGNLQMLALVGTQALSVGTVALVAQAAGRKDMEGVRFNTSQATSLSLLMGALFVAACALAMAPYARQIAADADTAQLTLEYLAWFAPSIGLQFLLTAQGSALRGIGNMKLALLTQVGSIVLNMVLAPVLVLGWGTGQPFGVAGAGLATFIAVLAATVWLGWKLARSAGPLRFPLAMLRPQLASWKRILVIGAPAGGEFLLMSAYLLLIYQLARPFGPEAQAGFGVGMRWLHAFFMPALAVSFGAAAVIGQNFGAHQHQRVRDTFRESLLQAGSLMLAAMLLLQIAPAWLISRLSAEPRVIETGAEFLRIISWNLLASALIFSCGGVFQGLGNTVPSLISSAVRIGLILTLALWVSARPGFQLHQLWILSVCTTLIQAALCVLFLRREFRLKLGAVSALAEPQRSAAWIRP